MACTGIKIRFEPDGPECRCGSFPYRDFSFAPERGVAVRMLRVPWQGIAQGHAAEVVLLSPPSSWLPTLSGRHRWSPAHLAALPWALDTPCFPSPESTQAHFPLVSFQGADASDWIWCKIHDETVSLSDTQLPPTVLCQPLLAWRTSEPEKTTRGMQSPRRCQLTSEGGVVLQTEEWNESE